LHTLPEEPLTDLFTFIGPTELSITDPLAVKALYSSAAKVSKGPWYTVLEPKVSLQMVRDKKEHARRRKVWDQGFSSKGMELSYTLRFSKRRILTDLGTII
jgi:cytochrome P450